VHQIVITPFENSNDHKQIMNYLEERKICEYLGLKIDSENQVLAYYGFPSPNRISGWQMVCHLSKLKMYLGRKIHEEHYKRHLAVVSENKK
jgi:hypothetical protein